MSHAVIPSARAHGHEDRICVLFGSDDGYARPLAASIRSVIAASAAPHALDFLVLAQMTDHNRERLRRSFPDARLTFLNVPEGLLATLPGGFATTAHISPAMWLRTFAADLLPGLSRVIYLDCDTITQRDLAPLWNTDLSGRGIGAARSAFQDFGPAGLRGQFGSITVTGSEPYFNSGVLVCDLDYWRGAEVSKKVQELVRECGDRLTYPDQDALNLLFRNDWVDVGFTWNQTAFSRILRGIEDGDAATALETASILHFTSKWKPWQEWFPAGLGRDVYLAAERGTAWAGEPLDAMPVLSGRAEKQPS